MLAVTKRWSSTKSLDGTKRQASKNMRQQLKRIDAREIGEAQMANSRCEVCRGRGLVRLPLYKQASFVADNAPVSMDEASRQYPCPECGMKAHVDKVLAVDVHSMVDSRVPDDALPHIREGVAHRLVASLLERGFIEFGEGQQRASGYGVSYPIIATLYAVHPSEGRRSIEDRLRERQDQFAGAVADEVIDRVREWGISSRYVDSHRIEKRRVEEIVREAVRHVGNTWSKERELRARGEIEGAAWSRQRS